MALACCPTGSRNSRFDSQADSRQAPSPVCAPGLAGGPGSGVRLDRDSESDSESPGESGDPGWHPTVAPESRSLATRMGLRTLPFFSFRPGRALPLIRITSHGAMPPCYWYWHSRSQPGTIPQYHRTQPERTTLVPPGFYLGTVFCSTDSGSSEKTRTGQESERCRSIRKRSANLKAAGYYPSPSRLPWLASAANLGKFNVSPHPHSKTCLMPGPPRS
jgi:hypothetical protein